MTKFIATLIVGSFMALSMYSPSSSAYFPPAGGWFPMQAQCSVSPAQATCAVYNPYPQAIFCQGRAVGTTSSGYTFWAQINTPVYPGNQAYVYVYAANPWYDPLISAYSEIWCR